MLIIYKSTTMKKIYLMVFFTICLAGSALAQKTLLYTNGLDTRNKTSVKGGACNEVINDPLYYVISQKFKRTLLGNFLPQTTGVNNYVSVDIADPKITLNLSTPFYNKRRITDEKILKAHPDTNDRRKLRGFLWAKFKGEIADGVAPIWQENDFAPKANYTLGATFILFNSLKYFCDTVGKVNTEMALWDSVVDFYVRENNRYDRAVDSLGRLSTTTDYTRKQALKEQLEKLKKYREEDIGGGILNSSYSTFNLLWLDVSGTFSPKSINMYNPLGTDVSTVIPDAKKYKGWEVGILFNHLLTANNGSSKAKMWARNLYWSFGVKVGRTDNVATLKGLDVGVSNSISGSGSTISLAAPKKTAYNITEIRDYNYVSFPVDVYKYLTVKRKNSIHLFAQFRHSFNYSTNAYQLEFKDRSDINLGLGYVITATAKDKTVTVIEPMIQFQDLTDGLENRKFTELKQRIFFGLRTSIPIENLFKAK